MRSVWAVARHTFIEGTRSQTTAVTAAVLAGSAVVIPLVARSTSFYREMQTFLAYSFGADGFWLSVMTILLTCGIICREIERRHVFSPITKPIARWRYLLGRWLGVVGIQAMLLTVLGVSLFSAVHVLRYRAEAATREGSPAERQRARQELDRVDNEVLVSRLRLAPSDFNARLQAAFNRIRDERIAAGLYQRGVELDGEQRTNEEIRLEAVAELESAAPGKQLRWRFEGLRKPVDPTQTLQLEMKVRASNANPLEELLREVILTNPDTGQRESVSARLLADAISRVTVPAGLITEGGALDVVLDNQPTPDSVTPIVSSVTVPANEMFILYRVGGFAGNFVRAMILLLLLQMFLAAVAVLAAGWLSYPVACLWCFLLYVFGLMSSFVEVSAAKYAGAKFWSVVGQVAAMLLDWATPDFSRVSPVNNLVEGVVIPWTAVFAAAGQFALLWCTVLLAIAGFIFTRRELARVIA